MKKILPVLMAALVGLAGCSKKDSTAAQPAPAPLEGTWTFQSESVLTTPRNGTAPSTAKGPNLAGSYTITFGTNGTLTSRMGSTVSNNPYTYSGNIITIPITSTKTQTLTVAELTAARLVLVEQTDDTANRYTTTDTFTR